MSVLKGQKVNSKNGYPILNLQYETENWLDYSKDCKYIKEETHERILSEYDEVRKMLISMINHPEKWCL